MKKPSSGATATPTIQVIERMFALIDVLASREEPVPLKEISERTGPHPSPTHPLPVIERLFPLIDVLASREEPVPLKEISERTGLHPSTTHRILNDLATGRFVDRPEPGCYRLGMRLLELGNLGQGRLRGRGAGVTAL